jgi:FKBP-type peptidyl-prolyl cis-trans isomerase FkpA
MNSTRISIGLATVGLLATLSGCNQTAAEPTSPPVPVAQADPAQPATKGKDPVIFTDKKELQQGTGPVDDDAPKTFTETKSGLKYRVLRKSDADKPTARDSVTVNYRGRLDNGKEFDSSYKRGEPISFPLGGVIPGWTEGMQLVGKGGMIELWIPAKLGYGARGAGAAVPPNATLHFIVELIEVQ